jgi:branched-chain amino acid transport system ATP-binding protein
MDRDPILQTVDLTKHFGALRAVDEISWSVEEGTANGILGPNGAGKTTFFNMITGVHQPTSGSVYFQGRDISNLAPYKIVQEGIVKTFQITNLFEGLTTFDNLAIAAQSQFTTFDMLSQAENLTEVTERANEMIDKFDLEHLRDKEVDKLSHGDQRKIEIAVALVTNPDVVLMDEPAAGVAADEIQAFQQLFEELLREEDVTFIIIEHNVDFLLDLVDSVTVFNKGTILSEGTPEEITNDKQVQKVYLT